MLTPSSLRLYAGRERPNISGLREPLAPRLLLGRAPEQAPLLLGRLFGLCADAHRLVATLAITAARGNPRSASPGERLALVRETQREHVRRIWLDWPRLLAGDLAPDPREVAGLSACPVLNGGDGPGMQEWVEQSVLNGAAGHWLLHWRADPATALACWSDAAGALPARVLRAARERAQRLRAPSWPLLEPAGEGGLREIAQALDSDEQFETMPQVGGVPRDSGCWTRIEARARGADDAWLRLGARIAELAALSLDDGDERELCSGALALADGDGIAWCEMARGLLMHRVRLAADGTVASYRVIAPTEWNFHPHGIAAQMLAQARDADDAAVVAAAFDPCVSFDVELPNA